MQPTGTVPTEVGGVALHAAELTRLALTFERVCEIGSGWAGVCVADVVVPEFACLAVEAVVLGGPVALVAGVVAPTAVSLNVFVFARGTVPRAPVLVQVEVCVT